MIMNPERRFLTQDFSLAITLYTLNYPLREILRDQARKTFVFEKDDTLDDTVADYWMGELKVEPKQFYNKSRELKARLKDEIN